MEDLYSLLMDDEPTAQEKARAYATALSGKQDLGNLALLTGDKVLSRFGQAQLQQAGQGQQGLAATGQARLRKAMEAQRAKMDAEQFQARTAAQLAQEKRQQGFTLYRDGLQNAAAERRARIMAAQEAAERQAAATAPMKGSVVPGLEIVEGAAPTADDAKKVKASLAASERMRAYIKQLRDLHETKGTELIGASATRMKQLEKKIQLEAKNIGELGALSGPDMGLVEDIQGSSPTSFWSNVGSLVGIDNTKASLEELERWVDDTAEAGKKTYGYRDAPGKTSLPRKTGNIDLSDEGQAGKAAIKGPTRTDPATGETRVWDGKAWVEL